jgi:hypothetical protein
MPGCGGQPQTENRTDRQRAREHRAKRPSVMLHHVPLESPAVADDVLCCIPLHGQPTVPAAAAARRHCTLKPFTSPSWLLSIRKPLARSSWKAKLSAAAVRGLLWGAGGDRGRTARAVGRLQRWLLPTALIRRVHAGAGAVCWRLGVLAAAAQMESQEESHDMSWLQPGMPGNDVRTEVGEQSSLLYAQEASCCALPTGMASGGGGGGEAPRSGELQPSSEDAAERPLLFLS